MIFVHHFLGRTCRRTLRRECSRCTKNMSRSKSSTRRLKTSSPKLAKCVSYYFVESNLTLLAVHQATRQALQGRGGEEAGRALRGALLAGIPHRHADLVMLYSGRHGRWREEDSRGRSGATQGNIIIFHEMNRRLILPTTSATPFREPSTVSERTSTYAQHYPRGWYQSRPCSSQ